MKIEILHFDGCPNYGPTVERVKDALRQEGQAADVVEVNVPDDATAQSFGFLGSPTVRIDGLDIEPPARASKHFGLLCRTYSHVGKQVGIPPLDVIRMALREAAKRQPIAQNCCQEPTAATTLSESNTAKGKRFLLGDISSRGEGMRRFLAFITLTFGLASLAVSTHAQAGPKTGGEIAAGAFSWGSDLPYVRNHFMRAVEEFPEDKYGYRATEDVRSFAEIVMHVARSNHLEAASALKKQPQDVSEFAFHSKAQALAKLKESFDELEEALKRDPGSKDVFEAMLHVSEHYGNLATYYRLNGLVPPASR